MKTTISKLQSSKRLQGNPGCKVSNNRMLWISAEKTQSQHILVPFIGITNQPLFVGPES